VINRQAGEDPEHRGHSLSRVRSGNSRPCVLG
jgi:hypothetical protein